MTPKTSACNCLHRQQCFVVVGEGGRSCDNAGLAPQLCVCVFVHCETREVMSVRQTSK